MPQKLAGRADVVRQEEAVDQEGQAGEEHLAAEEEEAVRLLMVVEEEGEVAHLPSGEVVEGVVVLNKHLAEGAEAVVAFRLEGVVAVEYSLEEEAEC